MAHLLDAEYMDEDDIGRLLDYVRVTASEPRRRSDRCSECAGPVSLDAEAGDYVCTACGLVQADCRYYVECWEDTERITVAPREGYKPIHHWHERLTQYHLQESCICVEHWAQILEAIAAQKLTVLSKESIRKLLRSIKLQRYNENWLQIMNRLCNYVPPKLSHTEVMFMDRVFDGVCAAFVVFRPATRKNLLNYNFILFRLLQLMGKERDVLCHFPQLKTKVKWAELDRIWGHICEYNDWEHMAYEELAPLEVQIEADELFKQTITSAWVRAQPDYVPKPSRKRTHSFGNRVILNAYSSAARQQTAMRAWTPAVAGVRKPKRSLRALQQQLHTKTRDARCAR